MISSSGVQPETLQDKPANNNLIQKISFKSGSRSELSNANNNSSNLSTENVRNADGSNLNLRIRSGDQSSNQNTNLEMNQVNPSSTNAIFSKHIPGRNSFAPNQINKIYPARSTSFSSESPTPLNLDYNRVSSLQGKGGEYESYLKQETYPKFPQQQQQKSTLLTDNAKNGEENMSIDSSEIRFKQRTSPDGIESAKRKDSEEDA